MLMNRVETALINSPPRRWLQRFYEVPTLQRLASVPLPPRARVLEVGCGAGYGTELILTRFGAAQVDAIDLDPAMVARARRRLARFRDRARVAEGSATDLRAALNADHDQDASYDAVVDFAIVHHVPAWRDALAEVARVLRPGGRFYFDEVTADALATRTYRTLFDHPSDDRFTASEFIAELPRHGLEPTCWITRIRGHYLLGSATRTTSGASAAPSHRRAEDASRGRTELPAGPGTGDAASSDADRDAASSAADRDAASSDAADSPPGDPR